MTEPEPRDKDIVNEQYKISLLLDVIKRYDTYIVSTNAKASLIIAFNSLILGTVLLKFSDIVGFYTSANVKSFVGFLLVAITVSTLLSLFFVFRVVYPYFGGVADEKRQQTSLIYFGSVASMSDQEYLERLSKISLEQLVADLSVQITILATGLKDKMLKMRHSIWAITFTLVIIFVLVLLRAVEGTAWYQNKYEFSSNTEMESETLQRP